VDPTKNIVHHLNEEISKLWYNVEEFKSNPQLSSLFVENNSNLSDNVDPNHLFKKLRELQSRQGNTNTNNNNNRPNVTLYHDGAITNKSFHMKELEDRLQLLEKIVGPSPENPSVGDMMASVEYLNARLELISDEMKLDNLVRRAANLRKELQTIQQKTSQQIEDQITKAKEEKINRMFDVMERWDQASLQLPTIISRLHSLKILHEESADGIQKLHNLESQQKLIQQTLENNKQLLTKVSQSLSENAKLMSSNIQSFDTRISQIQEKMKNMGL